MKLPWPIAGQYDYYPYLKNLLWPKAGQFKSCAALKALFFDNFILSPYLHLDTSEIKLKMSWLVSHICASSEMIDFDFDMLAFWVG